MNEQEAFRPDGNDPDDDQSEFDLTGEFKIDFAAPAWYASNDTSGGGTSASSPTAPPASSPTAPPADPPPPLGRPLPGPAQGAPGIPQQGAPTAPPPVEAAPPGFPTLRPQDSGTDAPAAATPAPEASAEAAPASRTMVQARAIVVRARVSTRRPPSGTTTMTRNRRR